MRMVKHRRMNKLIMNSNIYFAESEVLNPYLKYLKFVFADDQPNLNNQAIPYEEFANLKASAVGMPIKMRFLGKKGGAGSHNGSIPIGHIQDVTENTLENGTHQLIAEGAIYADEYPDIVEYLEEAFASQDAPGISWEISYKDSVLDKGVQFLKGVIARAATFVKHPAYGKRTALLALASDASLSEEEIEEQVVSLFSKEPEIQGGTRNVDLEQALAEIEKLRAELAGKATEVETLTQAANRVGELETENAGLKTQINEFQTAQLVEDRTRKAVEAGIVLDTDAEKLAAKQGLWIAMSEEIFNTYISDIAAIAKKIPARTEASARPLFTLPKISVDTSAGNGVTTVGLKERMRGLSRPETAE
jgi:hypothetical protein